MVVAMFASAYALGGLGGGTGAWSEKNPSERGRPQEAAEWVVKKKYGSEATLRRVVSVRQQVVRGMNYQLVLEVDFDAPWRTNACTVDNFVVWDDLGTFRLTTHSIQDDATCE